MESSVFKSGSKKVGCKRGLLDCILNSPYVRILCFYLAFIMTGMVSPPNVARASFISQQSNSTKDLDSQSLETLRVALENELIAEKLSQLGLTKKEIIERVKQLSVEEREFVLAKLNTIQKGGNDLEDELEAFFGAMVFVAVVVIGILYLGYLGIKAIAGGSTDKDKNEQPDSGEEVELPNDPDTD